MIPTSPRGTMPTATTRLSGEPIDLAGAQAATNFVAKASAVMPASAARVPASANVPSST